MTSPSPFTDAYADALSDSCGAPMHLPAPEAERLLELARLVAHGSERRAAPLSTYLAGRFVAARASAGVAHDAALAEAIAIAAQLLDPPER